MYATQFCLWLYPVWLLMVIRGTKADWPEDCGDVVGVAVAAAFFDFVCFCLINAIKLAGT